MNLGSLTKVMDVIPDGLMRTLSRQFLEVQKYSPHIFFAGGLVGSVSSTVLACRATLKLNDVLDEIEHDIKSVHELRELKHSNVSVMTRADAELDLHQYRQDLTYVYGKACFKIVKLYGPSVILGVASIGALTHSHIQLTRRNAALMAAYAAVQKAYEDYRERVREKLGVEEELDLYRGISTEITTDEETGLEVVNKIVDPLKLSPYSRVFDELSGRWRPDPEVNKLFLQCQQNFANQRLYRYGHLFLNEVYDSLDLERTDAGAVVGWIKNGDGDGYVDFGIFEARNSRFLNNNECALWLDFNVDGVIFEKLRLT